MPTETHIHKGPDGHIFPSIPQKCCVGVLPHPTASGYQAVYTGNKCRMGLGLSAAMLLLLRSPGGPAAGHGAHSGGNQPLQRDNLCLQSRVPLCLLGEHMHAR